MRAGLINQGGTCFLNSLLQIVFTDRSTRRDIMSLTAEDTNGKPQLSQLQLLFHRMQYNMQKSQSHTNSPPPYALSTKSLTKSFGWSEAQSGDQHDVNELYNILLEGINAQMPTHHKIKKYFEGKTITVVHCEECGYENSTQSTWTQINTPIRSTQSSTFHKLDDSLDHMFNTKEAMTDDSKYFCPECMVKVNATKTTKILKAPPIVTLSLNRFTFDLAAGRRKKLNSTFCFGKNLNLSPFMQHDDDANYELYGIISHSGDALSGHYHAYIKTNEMEWKPTQRKKMKKKRNGRIAKNNTCNYDAILIQIIKQFGGYTTKNALLQEFKRRVDWGEWCSHALRLCLGDFTNYIKNNKRFYKLYQKRNFGVMIADKDDNVTDEDDNDAEENSNWFDFDDTHVSACYELGASDDAYMLFYRDTQAMEDSEMLENELIAVNELYMKNTELEPEERKILHLTSTVIKCPQPPSTVSGSTNTKHKRKWHHTFDAMGTIATTVRTIATKKRKLNVPVNHNESANPPHQNSKYKHKLSHTHRLASTKPLQHESSTNPHRVSSTKPLQLQIPIKTECMTIRIEESATMRELYVAVSDATKIAINELSIGKIVINELSIIDLPLGDAKIDLQLGSCDDLCVYCCREMDRDGATQIIRELLQGNGSGWFRNVLTGVIYQEPHFSTLAIEDIDFGDSVVVEEEPSLNIDFDSVVVEEEEAVDTILKDKHEKLKGMEAVAVQEKEDKTEPSLNIDSVVVEEDAGVIKSEKRIEIRVRKKEIGCDDVEIVMFIDMGNDPDDTFLLKIKNECCKLWLKDGADYHLQSARSDWRIHKNLNPNILNKALVMLFLVHNAWTPNMRKIKIFGKTDANKQFKLSASDDTDVKDQEHNGDGLDIYDDNSDVFILLQMDKRSTGLQIKRAIIEQKAMMISPSQLRIFIKTQKGSRVKWHILSDNKQIGGHSGKCCVELTSCTNETEYVYGNKGSGKALIFVHQKIQRKDNETDDCTAYYGPRIEIAITQKEREKRDELKARICMELGIENNEKITLANRNIATHRWTVLRQKTLQTKLWDRDIVAVSMHHEESSSFETKYDRELIKAAKQHELDGDDEETLSDAEMFDSSNVYDAHSKNTTNTPSTTASRECITTNLHVEERQQSVTVGKVLSIEPQTLQSNQRMTFIPRDEEYDQIDDDEETEDEEPPNVPHKPLVSIEFVVEKDSFWHHQLSALRAHLSTESAVQEQSTRRDEEHGCSSKKPKDEEETTSQINDS
eukprot:790558_1